jgi:hypothetical protein
MIVQISTKSSTFIFAKRNYVFYTKFILSHWHLFFIGRSTIFWIKNIWIHARLLIFDHTFIVINLVPPNTVSRANNFDMESPHEQNRVRTTRAFEQRDARHHKALFGTPSSFLFGRFQCIFSTQPNTLRNTLRSIWHFVLVGLKSSKS